MNVIKWVSKARLNCLVKVNLTLTSVSDFVYSDWVSFRPVLPTSSSFWLCFSPDFVFPCSDLFSDFVLLLLLLALYCALRPVAPPYIPGGRASEWGKPEWGAAVAGAPSVTQHAGHVRARWAGPCGSGWRHRRVLASAIVTSERTCTQTRTNPFASSFVPVYDVILPTLASSFFIILILSLYILLLKYCITTWFGLVLIK